MSLIEKKPLQKILNLISLIREGMLVPIWSIQVFSTDAIISNPLPEFNMDSPTLQASDVKDISAEFVADPFIIEYESQMLMFFEVMNKSSGRGEIAFAVSKDGENWDYKKVVLREKFHLSYPQVFKVKDEIYMLPETAEANNVLLYKARKFPYEWEVACKLFDGRYLDPSIVNYGNKWWIFTGTEDRNLHLLHSEQLEGPWIEHARSPIIENNNSITRPGGRLVVFEDQLFRYTQDCSPSYGNSIRAFKIKKLSETEYDEEEVSIIFSGTHKENDWRKDGMHHIDQLEINKGKWLVAVDGHKFKKLSYFAWKLDRIKAKIFEGSMNNAEQ